MENENNTPLSVVIPTYGRCESVVSLVNLLVPQLMNEDELLVIDDGSQDSTSDILRLISNTSNEGMLKTWNKCLTSATHDWICIVHDDDTIESDALATIRKTIEFIQKPALIGHSYSGDDIDTGLRCHFIAPGPWAALHPLPIPSGVTIHREIIKAVGLFDERFQYSADIEYFSRIGAKFPSIVIENPRVVSFNLHGQNYEYKTWGKPDFLSQLEEIEKCLIEYSGMSDERALGYFQNKMNNYIRYIMDNSYKSEDKSLLRKFSLEVKKRKYLRKKVRLSAYFASTFNWFPNFLK
jgi:glycosyltransferase involved in cell wall biosynthesis